MKKTAKAHAAGPVELSDTELEAARKEGALQAERDAAAEAHRWHQDSLAGGPETNPAPTFPGSDEIMQFEHLLDLPPEELTRVIAPDTGYGIGEEKVAGLLKLERNGRNRTDYVKLLLDRLPIDHVRELPGAGGPGYTKDTTPVTEL